MIFIASNCSLKFYPQARYLSGADKSELRDIVKVPDEFEVILSNSLLPYQDGISMNGYVWRSSLPMGGSAFPGRHRSSRSVIVVGRRHRLSPALVPGIFSPLDFDPCRRGRFRESTSRLGHPQKSPFLCFSLVGSFGSGTDALLPPSKR